MGKRDVSEENPAPEPWTAPDGTQWLHFPDLDGGLWTGWQPGEPGTWNLSESAFPAEWRRKFHDEPLRVRSL